MKELKSFTVEIAPFDLICIRHSFHVGFQCARTRRVLSAGDVVVSVKEQASPMRDTWCRSSLDVTGSCDPVSVDLTQVSENVSCVSCVSRVVNCARAGACPVYAQSSHHQNSIASWRTIFLLTTVCTHVLHYNHCLFTYIPRPALTTFCTRVSHRPLSALDCNRPNVGRVVGSRPRSYGAAQCRFDVCTEE